jgi:hypothetical protein
MDLTRFIALLERRALFFAALRDLPDRFEGIMTPNLLAQARAVPGLGNSWELVRLMTYVNCWNEDTSESMALWSMYASQAGGVAVRSSYDAIRAALTAPDPMREDSPEFPRNELYIGRVRYIDFRAAEMPSDNAFWPVIHKRLPYGFEREVRLVTQPFVLNEEVGAVAAREGKDPLAVVRDVAPVGYDVVVDPAKLIQEVVVAPQAPDWLLDLIREVTKRYRIDVPVKRSDLDANPG